MTTQCKGRPSAVQMTREELHALRALVAMRSTAGRLHISLALEEFVHHPACSEKTRQWLQERIDASHAVGCRPNWPLSLRRMAAPTSAEMAAFRGPKALAMAAPSVRRGAFYVDARGRTCELQALDLYESDDVSINEPFRWRDLETGTWMAGRQTLATLDVYSAGFLGFTCVGRPKDAYRQEDIADHFLDICTARGMPVAWRLEHGSWAATFVSGIEMPGYATRWGALDALFQVIHSNGPRGKGLIEERFHMLQTLMAHSEGGITMGRYAGEFERTAQLMRRVGYDRRRADAGLPTDEAAVMRLWEADKAADGCRRAAERLLQRPTERVWSEKPIIPADVLPDHSQRPIPTAERWRFLPIKLAAVVRKGVLELRTANYPMPFRYAVNGTEHGIYLEDNYPVFAAFHPGRPEIGVTIGNRETGARNRNGWGMGEIIARDLPYLPLMPQMDLSNRTGAAGPGLSAKFQSTVRAEFRGTRKAMTEYQQHRAQVIAEDETRREAALARRSEARTAANRVEISGVAAPLPDLSALRQRSLIADTEHSPCNSSADALQAFRSRSLLTADERSS